MLSQIIPSTVSSEGAAHRSRSEGGLFRNEAFSPAMGGGGSIRSAGGLTIGSAQAAANEPLRFQFHQQVGFEGPRFDPRTFSGGSRPGRIRGALRASGAGCAGAGRGRQRASERNRRV